VVARETCDDPCAGVFKYLRHSARREPYMPAHPQAASLRSRACGALSVPRKKFRYGGCLYE
jgi:hypothetical protein